MKISIITVVLNNKSYIEDCIKSVLSQTYKDIEYIIVDGNSIDGTVEIIKKYEKFISKWISEPDAGIYDAMNKGIGLASGDIIGLLNSDDFYSHHDILSTMANLFKDSSVDACYGDLDYVHAHDTGSVFRSWRCCPYREQRFYWGWMPPHPTFFVCKRIYKQYGDFNLELGSSAVYELMLRFLLRHKIKSHYIPEVMIKMRTGGTSNNSLRNRLVANYMDRRAWRVNGLKPYPWTLILKPLRKINQYFFNT